MDLLDMQDAVKYMLSDRVTHMIVQNLCPM